MVIECERLILEEISLDDLESIHDLYSYPEDLSKL